MKKRLCESGGKVKEKWREAFEKGEKKRSKIEEVRLELRRL
jgi:hypothetical protein